MLATGSRIGAEEALRLGLVDHVAANLDALTAKCEEIASAVLLPEFSDEFMNFKIHHLADETTNSSSP